MEKVKKIDGLEEFPENYISFDLNKWLTEEEYEVIQMGFSPWQSEDKWYIYVEDSWIYFHRSWTGHVCYKTKIEKVPSRSKNPIFGNKLIYLLTETRINEDNPVSSVTYVDFSMTNFPNDIEFGRVLVNYIVDRILLRKNVLFPDVEEFSDKENFAFRFHLVGRASNNQY